MRLGCKAIANDYNPVAWFILKCTLEYPQRLAGKTLPLPELDLSERPELKKGDLADHVRLWGQWVLEHARRDLAPYYPVIDGKPTVAYLWARTIPCQDQDSRECGGIIPLLKTLWICKKAEKTLQDTPENRNRPDVLRLRETRNQTKVIINGKRALKLCPDSETRRVRFEIVVPEDTADVGEPTMSGATATCPFCGSQQPADYIKRCGQESKLKAQLTTVVYQEEYGKEYRPPTPVEIDAAEIPVEVLGAIADEIPHGVPDEPLPSKERHRSVGSQLPDYGFKAWSDLFTARQLLALMTFVKWTRLAREKIECSSYPPEWVEAIEVYLAINVDRLADYASTICIWETHANEVKHTFARFALPMTWDFAEGNPLSGQNRYYKGGIEYVGRFLTKTLSGLRFGQSHPEVVNLPAQVLNGKPVSTIITDPPYYDAIPYADLSDFFYVWLRRSIGDQFPDAFAKLITPKSDELVQHSDHFDGNNKAAKEFYESGMATTFQSARDLLTDNGRIVIVFAHKSPDAWETLVKAMIESGLVVTASWPIDTELKNSISSQGCASLATSLWMVCRKRPANAREGRYSKVKREMEERITERLRYFWDAGIQGPDFVWAAIGPALESYSSYKEVRRNTGEPFTVSDFLTEVRRIVTDFALGQILGGASTEALDEWTRYYLMHRNHFGTEDAPVGECILLAQGYGVSLDALTADRIGILKKASSGSKLRLLGHTDRNSDRVGQPHSSGGLPMIDMVHRVLKLWEAGDSAQLNAYLAEHGLRENALFKAVIQALIETSPPGTKERSLLETIINYQSSPSVGGDESSASGGRDGQQLTIKGVLS
jgi:adenine-specific DNA methylase